MIRGVVFLLLAILTTEGIFDIEGTQLRKPCFDHPKEGFDREFLFDEHKLPITIEVSNRISQRLASEILRIIIHEQVGYKNVTFVETEIANVTRTLQDISGCENPGECYAKDGLGKAFFPKVMINLEVWLSPGFNMEGWIGTGRIEDCGPLGPIGRAGWYVAKNTTLKWYHEEGVVVDHWRAFLDKKVTIKFNLNHDRRLSRYTLKNSTPDAFDHYCTDEEACVKGIYRPRQCSSQNGKVNECATLLADYTNHNSLFIREKIDKLRLLVEVAWVGPHLEHYVEQMTRQGSPVLFFNWKPTLLTFNGDFDYIAFPHCEDMDSLNEINSIEQSSVCDFEINQLEKMTWSKLQEYVPDVYHVVRRISFSPKDYVELLRLYKEGSQQGHDVHQVACDWLHDHQPEMHQWFPEKMNRKHDIILGGIFPSTGRSWEKSGLETAANLAIDAININRTLLKDHHIILDIEDGKCEADTVMKSFIGYVSRKNFTKLIGILGPACSDTVEPIAGVAKLFHTIIISYGAQGTLLNSREKYPFFSTIPENSVFSYVYLKLFDKFNWRRVAALTQDGQKYSNYITQLHTDFNKVNNDGFINIKFHQEKKNRNLTECLLNLKIKSFKIIIGDFYDEAARAVMCEAFKLNMTSKHEYQWFLPMWYKTKWFDTDYFNAEYKEGIDCKTSQMYEAIDGHMGLAYKYYADDDQTIPTGKTVKDWKEKFNYRASHKLEDMSVYAGYAYDAVWVYALALDALFKESTTHLTTLHSQKTSQRFISLINKTDFNGVSGHVKFNGSSRLSQIIIWHRKDNKTTKIGIYNTSSSVNGTLEVYLNKIKWSTLNPVTDGTPITNSVPSSCSLESLRQFLNVRCELAMVAANVMGLTLFVILIMVLFLFFKRRVEEKIKKAEAAEARMRELGIGPSSEILRLDEWEMPRVNIVTSFKLGEGAFGIVYGGEALIQNHRGIANNNDKGWVAVAVKTLKIGADIDEKLDFLSEANMMKRFDHTNIVRLLGVCTVGEPVYTVMEFMLYGDLKTYLQARRHLVKERNHQCSQEISDRQLTNMALDIARGLSYLCKMKYVHRDLACRNCLINTNRTVKIADFGMCRATYDKDYYKLNKRVILPVRWMAPESLLKRTFTPMSDIWSYGVLLYEMVTFGSFPYQEMNDNQVIDYVTKFGTLRVPAGSKPELVELFQCCWNSDPLKRPTAINILEHLAHFPLLISPCLDVPSVKCPSNDSTSQAIKEHSHPPSVPSITNSSSPHHHHQLLNQKSNVIRSRSLENGDPINITNLSCKDTLKGHHVNIHSKNDSSQNSDHSNSLYKEVIHSETAL